jgi:porin
MRALGKSGLGALAMAALGSIGAPAIAAPPQIQVPTEESLQPSEGAFATGGALGFLNNLERTNFLLGDMWGLRPWLSQYGISFALQETSEVLGNVTGGLRQGAEYDGLTQMALQLDTNRAFGWHGGLFDVSALQYHGRNLSADNLGTLQTASGIEADRATRLWELWYDQKMLPEDRLSIRVGQQSLDQEFMVSQNALLFVNTMFGWPMVPSADMPGGGPAYPLSAPGVRFKWRPIDPINILVGVFNGAPASNTNGDAQMINASGTQFPLNGGALAIAEIQYTYPALGSMIYANESQPLARTYKLGVWYDTEHFGDLRYDNTGLSLANPASTGIAQPHRGNYSIYAVADQMLWVDPNEADRTFNVFFRGMGTPEVNRNLVDFSVNAGFNFREPFLHRDDDSFGIGMGWAQVSPRAAGLDGDTQFYSGSYTPRRSSETFVEMTYQYAVTPWLQMQPDIQYVFNPGGGIANNGATTKVADELVIGLRTNILF